MLHHGKPSPQRCRRIQCAQTALKVINFQPRHSQAVVEVVAEDIGHVVHLAFQVAQIRQARLQPAGQIRHFNPTCFHCPQCTPLGPLSPGRNGLPQDGPVGNHQLRRRRGCGRPPVGHVVGDGEISLVSNPANHRNPAAEDSAGHNLFVEGPEVFQGTSAPGHDDNIGTAVRIQTLQSRRNRGSRVQTLDLGGRQQQAGQRVAAADNVLDVLPGRAGGRGYHSDYLGKLRQGPFAGLLEQTFLGQARLQPFQFLGQFSLALGQHPVHHKVGGSAGLVEAHPPVGPNQFAVVEDCRATLTAKQDAIQRGNTVLEGEIGMAGRRGPEIGNLSDNPQVGEEGVAFQQLPQVDSHLADSEDCLLRESQNASLLVQYIGRYGCPPESRCRG